MNANTLDTLGTKLANATLTTFVRIYPECRNTSDERLEAACAAMRANFREVIDRLLADTKNAPHLAGMAFTTATLTLAQAGVRVLQAQEENGHE